MTIIGIDLGTFGSAAAVLRRGRPVMIPSADGVTPGNKAFPSYVAVTACGDILVGEPARQQAAANPEGTITGFKRRMGTREMIHLRDHCVSPEQLSAFLIQKMVREAESFLGQCVLRAVVAVPAYFDDRQRRATRRACAIAGVEPFWLIDEPAAASLAHGLDRIGQEVSIAVVDLGGGTLDVTIMELDGGAFEVRALRGDVHVAGAEVMERVLDLCVTREDLALIMAPILDRCREVVDQTLGAAGMSTRDVDRLVLVGGLARVPAVRDFFEDHFGRAAEAGVDPLECVACGAAIEAGVLTGELGGVVLVDVSARPCTSPASGAVRLSADEKRRMIEEAERRADEDRRRRDAAHAAPERRSP